MINLAEVIDAFWKLLPKLPLTLSFTALALAGGIVLGFILALIRIFRIPVLSQLIVAYVSFMRCTPGILQLFLIFYGLPQLLRQAGIDINSWSNFTFAVIAFGLHCGAVMSEVIRSAYLAVPASQHEAASAVGMSYFQALRRIIVPQMLRIAIPVIGNNAITIFKESSLVFTVGVVDLMGQAQILTQRRYGVTLIETYLAVSFIYWFCSMLLGRLLAFYQNRSERKYKIMARKA
ncbi:amino acid ABC transporter permease [Paenibacillus sp. S150]|uniref:amino acid ABC transporter permease n=1 Tax=Paenibacillus sp. S150 TaxID=2749826 RepID=UPI001C58CE8A|nr:amino acid ABC transporter permease [Paenibacillus sp. S150]MBW4082297.1 amino acid ABC transporter permease [Paenibacillus sp. S150]